MPYQAPLTRREAILRHLREEIISGALPSDTVLKDGEVAARLGVSITPVREAILQLTAEGLVSAGPARTRRVTGVTLENALSLIDVMEVLSCAGVTWGVPHLTDSHIATMRGHLGQMADALDRGDFGAAAAAGAAISATMIGAGGNTEIQPLVDVVVTKASRLLALDPTSWTAWHTGYAETIALLEGGEPDRAVRRYRAIYDDVRAWLRTSMADRAPG